MEARPHGIRFEGRVQVTAEEAEEGKEFREKSLESGLDHGLGATMETVRARNPARNPSVNGELQALRRKADRSGREAALAEVRKKIREGLDAAKRGELFDGEEVLREILDQSKELRKKNRR